MDFSHRIINRKMKKIIIYINTLFKIKNFGGVLKSMLTLNEAIIDVKEG